MDERKAPLRTKLIHDLIERLVMRQFDGSFTTINEDADAPKRKTMRRAVPRPSRTFAGRQACGP
jgi:hypothetical protein